MSVVAFERKPCAGLWSETELNTMVAALSAAIASGDGRGWETGATETGDAQFYLLGPLPDQACELCVSRIGGRYILEDGSGIKASPLSRSRRRPQSDPCGGGFSHAPCCCGVRSDT
jgi:hypothetical protein